MRRLLFRLDCSVQIGSGHLMRCLTLADAWRREGGQSTFMVRDLSPMLQGLLIQRGHRPLLLTHSGSTTTGQVAGGEDLAHSHWLNSSQAADAQTCLQALSHAQELLPFDGLIVDHYALDQRWEVAMRGVARWVMVIDDLADRQHSCDMLLDQNLGRQPEHYARHVPASTRCLLGPTYALLRPEFAEAREPSLRRRSSGTLGRGLISLGGVDAFNLSGACLAQLEACDLPADTRITVVLGIQAPHLAAVQAQVDRASWPVEVVVDARDMAQRLSHCDWAIGAAGASAWERCCLGVPSLVMVLADNQLAGARALEDTGAAVVVPGPVGALPSLPAFSEGLHTLFSHARTVSGRAAAVCDGLGTQRVLAAMSELGRE